MTYDDVSVGAAVAAFEAAAEGASAAQLGALPDPVREILARMTEAMMDWLADDAQVHPLNLQNALVDFNTLLGMYTSALERKAIDLPSDPADRLIDRLRQRLIAEPRA